MATESSEQTFTPYDRINQLSTLDAQIPVLLNSASLALQSLTSPPSATSSLPATQATFLGHIETYFTTLSAIDVQLRRQIYALQEAGLIQEGTAKDARDATAKADVKGIGEATLETGWLNSRAKDTVGKGMEAELWERARRLMEGLSEGKTAAGSDKDDDTGDSAMDLEDKDDEDKSEDD